MIKCPDCHEVMQSLPDRTGRYDEILICVGCKEMYGLWSRFKNSDSHVVRLTKGDSNETG